MSPALPARLRALAGGCLLLAACTDPVDPPPRELNVPERQWHFVVFDDADSLGSHLVRRDEQTGGEVNDTEFFGITPFAPEGHAALGEVFSSPDGVTYWVGTEDGEGKGVGNTVGLDQFQSFRKDSDTASLELHLTAVQLDLSQTGFAPPCPDGPLCRALVRAEASLRVQVNVGSLLYDDKASGVEITRRHPDRWELRTSNHADAMFTEGDFTSSFTPSRATLRLTRPVTVPVDISGVPVNSEFTLSIHADVAVESRLRNNGDAQGTYVSAYLRDPVNVGGTTLAFRGLTPTNRPLRPPSDGSLGRAPACTTPGPGAGTIQLAGAAFSQDESAFPGLEGVVVRRAGGTRGPASVTLRTSDGTAVAGRDYQALTTTVAFADGDSAPRAVRVPVLPNTRVDGDRTVNVTLSKPGGCATLGAAGGVVTIYDDDAPPPPSGFSVGGTVTGLTGSGLVLRNGGAGETLAVGNGAFTFTQRLPDAFNYTVTVATQPTSPSQVCTVANGSGAVAGADVTNVAVTCTTPAPVGALDPTFGIGGKVATPLNAGEAEAVAVQPDGKIVVAGWSAVSATPGGASGIDFTVLRYNADGTPDAGFGTGGVATAGFPAGRSDEAFGVALQPDGRIVVVGQTQLAGGGLDFAVARFTADGRLDASFGTGGLVVTDFGPGSAAAQGVVVQPDGRIVVAGHSPVGLGNDFAVARYNADGTPDATFGTGGRVTTNVVGRTDLGRAVALAPGGKIVVAGRAEQSDGRGDDFALVRYNADGTPDASFGSGGVVTTDIAGGSQQANGVVVQPDGRIVVGGYSGRSTGTFDFALARYNADGTLDAGFGTAGTAVTDLSGQDDFGEDLGLQPDGKLVVIGRRTSGTLFDLALARYLPNGAPDTGFGAAGRVEVDFFGGSDQGQAVAVQPDGRIVGAGHARNGTSQHVVVVRVQR